MTWGHSREGSTGGEVKGLFKFELCSFYSVRPHVPDVQRASLTVIILAQCPCFWFLLGDTTRLDNPFVSPSLAFWSAQFFVLKVFLISLSPCSNSMSPSMIAPGLPLRNKGFGHYLCCHLVERIDETVYEEVPSQWMGEGSHREGGIGRQFCSFNNQKACSINGCTEQHNWSTVLKQAPHQ